MCIKEARDAVKRLAVPSLERLRGKKLLFLRNSVLATWRLDFRDSQEHRYPLTPV